MWIGSNVAHRFSHLNRHIHRDRLLRILSPAMGSSAALAAMRTHRGGSRHGDHKDRDIRPLLYRSDCVRLPTAWLQGKSCRQVLGNIRPGVLNAAKTEMGIAAPEQVRAFGRVLSMHKLA